MKQYRPVFKEILCIHMERFHIREAVIFEDILPEEYLKLSNALKVSRSRMSLQQILDDPPNTTQLIDTCLEYNKDFDKILHFVSKNRQIQLNAQPVFHWYIDNAHISSSCWLLESVLIKHVISEILEDEAMKILKTDVKKANKIFKSSIEQREELVKVLSRWKWQQMQNNIIQQDWHLSKINALKAQQCLAMIDVGISKHAESKTLFIVSQRAIRHAALAQHHWPNTFNHHTLHISEALRYLFSSNMLWAHEKYGQSIFRIKNWLLKSFDVGPYKNIQEQLSSITFLLSERERDNESIYFHKVQAGPTLSESSLLMCNNDDIPHPPFEETIPTTEMHEDESDVKSDE